MLIDSFIIFRNDDDYKKDSNFNCLNLHESRLNKK